MDPVFLEKAQCYFAGGTQLAMSHGEFRESRDIDFLLSSADGLRMIRESIGERSLGALFRDPIHLAREVRKDRDSIRTFIAEGARAEPLKFEVIVEGRIRLEGALDETLGLPTLAPHCAIAEKLLANADRGRAREHRSRDVIDLAFVMLQVDEAAFLAGYRLARTAYGQSIKEELREALKMLELDAGYRGACIEDLRIEDAKALRKGLERLRRLQRSA